MQDTLRQVPRLVLSGLGDPTSIDLNFIGNYKPPRLTLKVLRTSVLYYSVLQPVVFDWSRLCSTLTVRILPRSVLLLLLLENVYVLILCICLMKILKGYLSFLIYKYSWSRLPLGLRCGCVAASLLWLRFRIRPGAWIFVCCKCSALSGRGLCVGLVTSPYELYRLWRAWVWSWTINNEEALTV